MSERGEQRDDNGATRGDDPLDAALGRLRAARAAAGDGDPVMARGDAPTGPDADASWWSLVAGPADGAPDRPGPLHERMTDRRTASATARHVAAAYAAAQGHLPDAAGDEPADERRPRWGLRPRAAIVAVVVVLLLGAAVATAAAWPRGDVRTLAEVRSSNVGGAPSSQASAAAPSPPASGFAASADPVASAAPSQGGVVVHVVGQVSRPGLVTLPAGARVADAVAAAGGATDHADLAAVNLARPVVDGEQLRVPAPGEAVAPAAPSASPGGAASGIVNLNTADEAALDALPGIGPALAGRIVAWRQEHGGFASVDELDEVSGIGPALLDGLRDLVRV